MAKKELICVLSYILAALFIRLSTTPLWAGTYYLDAVNGSDSNPGTSELPWKTLSKAVSTLSPGDTVLMRDGSYGAWPETRCENTGWITYKADSGHTPIISYINIENPSSKDVYLIFDGLTIDQHYPGAWACGIRMTYVKHLKFHNLNIVGDGYLPSDSGDGTCGIRLFKGQDVDIKNCTIGGLDPNDYYGGFVKGIRIGVDDANITDCDIYGCGIGLDVGGSDIVIARSHVHKTTKDAVMFGGVTNFIMEDNEVYDLKQYKPVLSETPTETTWSEDGYVMTNLNAKWNTEGAGRIYGNGVIKMWVKSGNNVCIGDNDNTGKDLVVASVDSDTQLTLMRTPKLDLEGPAPSNVNYYFVSEDHGDNLQTSANTYCRNVIVRRNKLYDCIHQIWWCNPRISSGGEYLCGGENWIIENNIFYQRGTDPTYDLWSTRTVGINYIDGLVYRNNINIGMLQIKDCKNVSFSGNITSYNSPGSNSGISYRNNITNRGWGGAYGNNIFFHPNGKNEAYSEEPQFWGMFKDPDNADFSPASETSLMVNRGDPNNYAETDFLGKYRNGLPDAGCYEYNGLDDPN